MKKVLITSLLIAAMSSTAWGVQCTENGQKLFCQWATGCYSIDPEYTDPPLDNAPCPDVVAACVKDGQLFAGSSTPAPLNAEPWGAGEICSNLGLTFLRGKEVCNMGYCSWESGTKCVEINPDPTGEHGDPVPDCAAALTNCEVNGQRFSDIDCTVPVGGTPIIAALPAPALANSMSAMQSSVSLQVTGAATVRIFDMKGTAIRAQRVEKGSYVVQLSSLPRGLYIVQAASGSWKQTAKVAVK